MDVFIEKMVGRRKTPKDKLVTALLVVAAFILSLVFLSIRILGGFGLLLVAGAIYGAYFLIKSRNVEFEYIVTNGDLDIDKIIAQRKRKRIFSANCKEFDIVAKVKSDKYTHDVQSIQKRIEAVSSLDAQGAYFVTLQYKGERTVVFFEPDQRMLDIFKTFIPRKVFDT